MPPAGARLSLAAVVAQSGDDEGRNHVYRRDTNCLQDERAHGRGAAGDLLRGRDRAEGRGWVAFAAIMLGFAGFWAFFEGILAISSSKIYTANATYVFSDLHTWGWIMLALGIAALFAAFGLFAGSELARWFGSWSPA